MTAAGDVSDYDSAAQADLISSMATTLGVPDADVSLTVTAASVNLVFEVAVADEAEADTVTQQADSSLGTAADATTALGVSVQSAPVTETIAASPTPPPMVSSPSTLPTPPPPFVPPPPEGPIVVGGPLVEDDKGDNTAAIAGAVVGGLVVVAILAVCVIMKGRRDGKQEAMKTSTAVKVDDDGIRAAHAAGGVKREAI